jgi:hypothetical protein
MKSIALAAAAAAAAEQSLEEVHGGGVARWRGRV